MTTTAIVRWHAPRISVNRALADASELLGELTILASTPGAYITSTTSAEEGSDALANCYELRAFNPSGEVSWSLPYGTGVGVADLLLDAPLGTPDTERWEPREPLAVIERIRSSHVVWGSVVRSDGGRATVREERVREVSVPIGARVGSRVCLAGEELVVAGIDGNAMVALERLLRFEPLEGGDGTR